MRLIFLSGKTPATASKPPAKKRARVSSDDDAKESAPTVAKVHSLGPASQSIHHIGGGWICLSRNNYPK